jgi:Skp family chaperone for outer membrane proteins
VKNILSVCVLTSFLILGGCRQAGVAGGVAIIDLDKVATAMGWLDEISKSLQTADAELRGQLGEVLQNTLASIEEAKKQVAADARLTPAQVKVLSSAKDPQELGELPLTKEQRDKLLEAVNKANVAWRTATTNFQQALQGRRATLIQGCREKIRPAARRVALASGMSVVFVTSENMLYFDPQSADITEKVIDDLQRTNPHEKPRVTAPAPASAQPPAAK